VQWGAACGQLPCVDLPAFYTVASGERVRSLRPSTHRPCACVHTALHASAIKVMAILFYQLGDQSPSSLGCPKWPGLFLTGSARRLPPPEHAPLRSSSFSSARTLLASSYQLRLSAGWPPDPCLSKASFPGLQCSGYSPSLPKIGRAFASFMGGVWMTLQFGTGIPAIRAGRLAGTTILWSELGFFQAYSGWLRNAGSPAQLGNTLN